MGISVLCLAHLGAGTHVMSKFELFKRSVAVVLCAIGLSFSLSGMTQDTEQLFWDSVKKSNVVLEYRLYLKQYPQGAHAEEARKRIAALQVPKVQSGRGDQEATLRAREEELRRREQALRKQEQQLGEREAEVNRKENEIAQKLALEELARKRVAAEAARMAPGQVFKDCSDCPEMVVIPAGTFDMGGTLIDELPVHRVTLRSFSMGKTEVTQAQWRAVMGSSPSRFSNCGDTCPVEQVSWEDAKLFVSRLSQKTGKSYRLPSEAEWEYSCRSGGREEYCGSSRVDEVAWYLGTGGTQPVARKGANAWGLHDMSGNVWEWTEDCWNGNYSGAPTDGGAWTSGVCFQRVVRGSSWSNSLYFRYSFRLWNATNYRGNNLGFRVARTN